MGASQVLIGRRLAEHLGLHQEENVTPEGVRIPTAERGGRQMPAKDLAFAGGSVGSRERERSETQVGAPRQAWPTLVATPGSYAFRMQDGQPGPGMVQVLSTGEWEEPLAVERERAIGYLRNATAVEGVMEAERWRALGGAIDQHTLVWLMYRAEKR
ncbi:hypothetical protein CLOP_g23170 [Closterium sp. NIES-67]|nr:hypothetical protein CLOP_g23170 [Closterium sp. NIES-67]